MWEPSGHRPGPSSGAWPDGHRDLSAAFCVVGECCRRLSFTLGGYTRSLWDRVAMAQIFFFQLIADKIRP